MRKTVCLLLCLSMAFCFAACKKEKSEKEVVLYDINSQSTPVDQGESPSPDGEQQPSESGTQTSDTMPLAPADGSYVPSVEALYEPAAKIYYELTSGNLPVDWDLGRKEIKVNGSVNTYFRISDSRFDSKAELEEYLKVYFTDACIKTFYNPAIFYDYEGHLYAIAGVSAENALYAGRNFTLIKQTNKRIQFDCTSYFYKTFEEIPKDRQEFKTVPEDASKYNTKVTSFELEVDESGYNWRFSKFDNIK